MHFFHIEKFEVDIYPFFVLNKICTKKITKIVFLFVYCTFEIFI